ITGTGGVTVAGSGIVTLSGNNSYDGSGLAANVLATSLNGGELSLGSAQAIGSTGMISFGGGALQYTSANTTDYSNRFSQAAGQTYKIDTNGQNVTFGTKLTSSNATFTKLGAGTLTFSVANTYTGMT